MPIGADGVPINNEQFLKIINYLRIHESVTNADVVTLLGVKSTRAKVILREMVAQNLLETSGEKRYRTFILKGSHSSSYGE